MRLGRGSKREVGIAHGREVRIAAARLRANLVPSTREAGGDGSERADYDGLGAKLSRIRREKGLELEDVSRALHIQIHYLTAIEAGRFDQLPGDAYARGFLRAYADHLDLDARRALKMFTEESNPTSPPRPASLPQPVDDSHRPPAKLIMLSLLSAALVIGVWWLTSEPASAPEEVPPPPDHLSALLAPPLEETLAGPGPAPGANEDQAPTLLPPPAAPELAAPVVANALAVEREASRDAILLAGNVPSEGDAADPAEADAPTPARPPIPIPRPDIAALMAHAPARDPVVPAPPPLAEADAGEATAGRFGVAPNEARVVLKARADSWIQVQDGAGKLLLTRILNAGESYYAPDRPGLILTTGNLGGLEIVVDGASLGTIGDRGEVRRNLPLDAARLLAIAERRQ